MNEQYQTEDFIVRQLLGNATRDDLQQIQKWRQLSDTNEVLYKKVIKKERIQASFDIYDSINSDIAFAKVIAPAGAIRRLMPAIFKYAAVIVLPLLFALITWLRSDIEHEGIAINANIVSGGHKATVLLSDGNEVELDKNNSILVLEDDGQVIGKDSLNTLVYHNVETEGLTYNTVKIPNGGEYQLQLSDGTKVWLNSGSVFKFPVGFKGDKREVSLKGEAYFHVAHNVSKPFIVHTDNSRIKVFGTCFNVMCYENDKVEQITLVEGSVGIEVDGKQTLIRPGEQAELSIPTSSVGVREVEVSLYTSWVEGVFKFKNMPINELSKKLARWYDVDFYFANDAVSEFPFTGRVNRNADFEYFMALIEKTTNVEVTVEGRTVLVKEKK
ncbi:MAG: FecR domain-containing protein [Marinilabiliaceae bacterium]|nr:FecR domain-containing protein [Marinilabiliaceae bacterium]